MGFYASFSTALLAIFGLVVKLPTVGLEKRLKLLEIQEKELAVKEKALAIERLGKPNPSVEPIATGEPADAAHVHR